MAARGAYLAFAPVLACLAPAGCHAPPHAGDRAAVSQAVEARFGAAVGPRVRADQVIVPDGVEDGRPLSEDQAVLLALWNNAAFHEALVELDLTRADLVQAGLLPNPDFVYFWPEPNKPFKYLIDLPLDALVLRPLRVKAAAAETHRAAGRVTQLALDLIRDARQAHSDLRLAQDLVAVANQSVELRGRVAELAEARLRAGDASALELSTARVDALQAAQDAARAGYEVTVAGERLRFGTGLSGFGFPLAAADAPADFRTDAPVDDLVAEAVAGPDATAAAHAVRAADERVRVARLGWVRVLGVLDATSGRVTGHEFGPALRFTVPLFNRNQGGVARAEAERDQLDRRRRTVHDQIVLDVRTAYARYRQARTELDLLREKTRPEVEAAVRRAGAAYREGNATYLIVLEANRQLIGTYAREAQLAADLRRAWADLERGVGRRLTAEGPTP